MQRKGLFAEIEGDGNSPFIPFSFSSLFLSLLSRFSDNFSRLFFFIVVILNRAVFFKRKVSRFRKVLETFRNDTLIFDENWVIRAKLSRELLDNLRY